MFLFLGAIVNVAVAWGFAAGIEVDLAPYDIYTENVFEPFATKSWTLYKLERPGATSFSSSREVDSADGTFETDLRPREVVPKWTTLKSVATRDIAVAEERYVDGRGWPTLSLWCEYFEITPTDWQPENDIEFAIAGGVEGEHPPWAEGGEHDSIYPHALPLRPIWPDFAINTVFYAAILWLLTFGPFTARRLIRRKRGHCIKCGYDLRGTSGGGGEVCPECGAQRT